MITTSGVGALNSMSSNSAVLIPSLQFSHKNSCKSVNVCVYQLLSRSNRDGNQNMSMIEDNFLR